MACYCTVAALSRITGIVKPVFFKTPADLRAWFEKNHTKEDELLIGYYKKASGKPSITHKQGIDVALCFGWIDSVGRRIDEERWCVRYTPRRKTSIWSAVNLKRYKELLAEGLVHASGEATFKAREPKRVQLYSFEQKKEPALDTASLKLFKANKKAWAFFESQPPSYRKPAIWLIISAKKEETRKNRLLNLIECSAAGERIKALTREKPAKS